MSKWQGTTLPCCEMKYTAEINTCAVIQLVAEQKKTLVILNGRVESADIYELELAANIKDEEVIK